MQIATPAIVAAVLLLFFIVYIVWQRSRLTRKREYNCNKVRTHWLSKSARVFTPLRDSAFAKRVPP